MILSAGVVVPASSVRSGDVAVDMTKAAEMPRPDGAPVPGWAGIVAIARVAAQAADPPCAFRCEARDGRLTWRDVRGSPAFLDLLWILEELSASLCEVCGGPGCARERWGGWVRTLCPRHVVDVAAAGPRFVDVYAQGWRDLREGAGAVEGPRFPVSASVAAPSTALPR